MTLHVSCSSIAVAAAELQALEEQAAELADKELQLGLLEQRLTSEIEAFLEREDLLQARQSAAAAQVRVSESLADVAQGLGSPASWITVSSSSGACIAVEPRC